ncbi:MAG: hypothetical protein Q8P51_07690 [Ignavibacteria bacterium]|nr:hypothetical protein [Ignavibacteria bacterium]
MNSHKTLRAYLSGGMEFAKGEGSDWRMEMDTWVRKNLNHTVYNPNLESEAFLSRKYPAGRFRDLKHENIDLYVTLVRDLIDMDSSEIAEKTDYVVCYWDESAQRGAGTKGEVTIARFTQKPVYMVTAMELQGIPGWVLGCTTKVFGSFDDLKVFLLAEYAGKQD